MKRVAALFAVMGAMTAVVPTAAPAATTSGGLEGSGLCLVLAYRLC
jgi:hypothetical protein